MKHAIIAACGAVTVASTLALSAQTPSTPARPQTPQPSQSTPSRTDEKTTTLTGCLKAWDASMSGPSTGSAVTPGATAGSASTAPGGKFVLTNVRPDSATTAAANGSATKPTTTTMSGAAGADTKQYMLSADSGVNLSAHNNHQVRVTGKVETMANHSAMDSTKPGATTRPGESAPGSSAGSTGSTGSTADQTRTSTDRNNMGKDWPTMTVSSVTMISATCTNPTN